MTQVERNGNEICNEILKHAAEKKAVKTHDVFIHM